MFNDVVIKKTDLEAGAWLLPVEQVCAQLIPEQVIARGLESGVGHPTV